MSNLTGYNCTLCGVRHEYTLYVMTHRFEHLTHKCSCGALHDIYDHEASLVETAEPHVMDWVSGVPPVHEGFYHIRFPNGTEADRNWYWSHRTYTFLYDKDSTVSLAFSSIGAWRGLDRKYN